MTSQTSALTDDTFEQALALLRSRSLLGARRTTSIPASLDRDRVTAALLGLAVGNALGGLARRERRRLKLSGALPASLLEAAALTAAGAPVTATTQQALISGTTWLAEGDRAPIAVSDRLVDAGSTLRHPGNALSAAVVRRSQGRPWWSAGVPSYGNAALARATAVAFTTRPDSSPTAVALDTLLTHAHPLAVATAGAYADALLELVGGQAGWSWLVRLATAASEPMLAAKLRTAVTLRGAPTAVALRRIGTRADAPTALARALWLLCSHPHDGASAVAEAAAQPGDPATTAAITGALVGARDGMAAFPSHWVTHLELAGELRQLADRAVDAWTHGDHQQPAPRETARCGSCSTARVRWAPSPTTSWEALTSTSPTRPRSPVTSRSRWCSSTATTSMTSCSTA